MVPPRRIGWASLVAGLLLVLLYFWQWQMQSRSRQEEMYSSGGVRVVDDPWALDILLPGIVLLISLVLAWRWPIIGVLAFGGITITLAILWAFYRATSYVHPIADIIVALAFVPHVIVTILFLSDWSRSRSKPGA